MGTHVLRQGAPLIPRWRPLLRRKTATLPRSFGQSKCFGVEMTARPGMIIRLSTPTRRHVIDHGAAQHAR